MFRKVFLTLCAVICFMHGYGQADSSRLRVSLLTCGPGTGEVWEVFGHTAIRVVDSQEHSDLVYNYGTFEFGPGFEIQFMRGKLLYSLSVAEYRDFMSEYVMSKRSVEEQVLLLNHKQGDEICAFLDKNAETENRYYKYDFFFDNCATRLRDVFPKSFGRAFVFGKAIPDDSKVTFRDIINVYFYRNHWTRLGVNILLGSKIDRVMSNTDIMFLPDYLRDGVGGATVNGEKIATTAVLILPGGPTLPAGANQGLVLTVIIALLTIAGLCVPQMQALGKFMSFLLLFVTGLLGCLILVMWFATDHQGCSNNFNVLWCLPTNLIAAFMKPRAKGRYAIVAIILVFVSLLLHVLKVQGLTILELSPLFLALLFVYGMMLKRNTIKNYSNA